MLIRPEIIAFLATVNPKESEHFYQNILGLKITCQDKYALEFTGKNISLRITTVQELIPHRFAVLGFRVENIDSQINSLREKGVKFERYAALDQDELGIWTSPSKARVAWFKDPDGNLLSLTQMPV